MAFLIIFALIVIFYAIAFSRKGRVGVTAIGSRRREVYVAGDPAAVFARLQQIGGRYRIDDADPASKRLVLSSSVTMFTWGFLYPIEVQPHGTAGCRIDIGIHSKVFQMGPLVTNAHQRCAEEISQWLSIPATRVA